MTRLLTTFFCCALLSANVVAAGPKSGDIESEDKLYGLFVLIAQQRVGERPNRIEPRAVKRRPKAYPLLTIPRALARAHVQKYGHPEKLK